MLKRSRLFQCLCQTVANCPAGPRWLYLAARSSVALLFIYAGAIKLADPRGFARAISGYGLLPEELLVPVAIGLPAVELIAGLGLFFNLRGSLKVTAGLVLLFLGVLGYAILSELNVDCGCFSTDELDARENLRTAFFRDVGLMLSLAYLFLWERGRKHNHLQAFADSGQENFEQ